MVAHILYIFNHLKNNCEDSEIQQIPFPELKIVNNGISIMPEKCIFQKSDLHLYSFFRNTLIVLFQK